MKKKTHKLVRDEWSEVPAESEFILCSPNDGYADPECSADWNVVDCKRCLKSRRK